MLEIEIKAPLDDRPAFEAALRGRGFTKARTVRERDTYYNGIDRSFKDTDEALRLRRTESGGASHAAITYKGPKIDARSATRTEYETGVEDGGTMHALLMALGYTPVLEVRKTRDYYTLSGITACVDEVDGLGHFAELETLSEDESGKDAAVEQLLSTLEALGVSRGACTRASYLEMLLAKLGRD